MDDDRTAAVGLRVPRDLLEKIDARAAQETRTRSNLIVHLLRQALESRTEQPQPSAK